MVLMNLLLMVAWAVLTGNYSPSHLLFGFVVGYVALWIMLGGSPREPYFRRVWRAVGLLLYFLWELLISNLKVVWEVIRPGMHMKPGIFALELKLKSEGGIVLLANLITLTPGTLSIDVSCDRKVLYVHTMYANTPDTARTATNFESWIREIFD